MEPTAAPSMFEFSVFGWPWTGLVTLFSLLVYYAFGFKVSRERRKHNAPAPALEGPQEFMRAFRIHANTGEQLIVFLPLLWMAALSTNDFIAAAIGVIWPISRVIYAVGYTKDPAKRLPGFVLGFAVILLLFALVAFELGHALFFWHDEGAAMSAGMN